MLAPKTLSGTRSPALKTPHAPSSRGSRVFGVQVPVSVRPAARRHGSRVSCQVQANLFSRFFRVIRATVDNLVGSAEDPEALLDRVVIEMNQDVTKLRQANAQALASQRQIMARANNVQAAADQWLKRAELAVSQGQDELAREALKRRKTLQGDADRLNEQAALQGKATDQLRANVQLLESKIQEARNKKETLKARAATAKSSKAIQELIGGLQSTSSTSFAAFDKMEEKVMALEAEAESTAAMATPDSLEGRFAMLEGGSVEDELKALKKGTQRQPAGAIPGPRFDDVFQKSEPKTALDLELEELKRQARG
ncbi:putative membrane-associated 30 kDa protein, chloroplastic [Dunaliella salina]|uniref:Membrane-associated 30 kDa protein, chloroplastic n=1 Tax=Dunaliella salina TaxID=3046 RepID=A0ABQ7GEW8_DUNSA|nr:putative membrane-associated 30 kDa protein, chloroplastic [Dunaliella salina]|eukprot:KAF5833140.1 putative membrane-associated 30 kDa protein, chloroplastic [Dunaliella salina]